MNLNMALGSSANALTTTNLLGLLAGANSAAGTLGARTGATSSSGAGITASTEAELETRMRALREGIEALRKQIDQDLAPTIREANKRMDQRADPGIAQDLARTVREVDFLSQAVKQLQQRLDNMDKGRSR